MHTRTFARTLIATIFVAASIMAPSSTALAGTDGGGNAQGSSISCNPGEIMTVTSEKATGKLNISCNGETATRPGSSGVGIWNCGNGLNPFISPRDPAQPPDYPAVPDRIWIEGYGGYGALGAGSRSYVDEATRRVANAFHSAVTQINPDAFIWAGFQATDTAPPDFVAAYIGIGKDGGIDMRPLSARVAEFAAADYTSADQGGPGKIEALPGVDNFITRTRIPPRNMIFPQSATSVPFVDSASGPVDEAWYASSMSRGIVTWSVEQWVKHLLPGEGMAPAYATELNAHHLPITATWTYRTPRWVTVVDSPGYWTYDSSVPPQGTYTPAVTHQVLHWDWHTDTHAATDQLNFAPFPEGSQQATVSFTLRVPNRPHQFPTVRYGEGFSGFDPSVQDALQAIIDTQMNAKKGTLYYLPTFLGPMDPSSASTCGEGLAFMYGVIIGPDAPPATCAVSKLDDFAAWLSNFDPASQVTTGGCYIGWSRFRIPFPKLPADVFGDLTGLMKPPIVLGADVPQPIIGQPVTLTVTNKILPPAAQTPDRTITTGGSTAELHVTIDQVGVTLSVGALGANLGIFRVDDGKGGWKPSSVIAIPRDPSGGIGGGYDFSKLTITFNRTPLSVLQDPACSKYATDPTLLEEQCGLRVEKGDLVFVLRTSTWWDSIYVWNSSGFRGTFNPRWSEIDDASCLRLEPWHPEWGFDIVPYGRFVGKPLYKASEQDWDFANSQVRFGLNTPFGDNTLGRVSSTCAASPYGKAMGNNQPHGSPLFRNLPQEIYISPRQVQVTGGSPP